MPHRQQTTRQTASPHRLGPRPLPLFLMAHASAMMGSRIALPLLKSGSLSWNPALTKEAEAIRQSLEAAGPDAWTRLDQAVAAEGVARHQAMLDGITRYHHHPYHRDLPSPPILWSEGTSRLLDYRLSSPPQPGRAVLVVPSLVNRAYVLDLTARRSLMRYLANRGLQPFMMDWGAPGPAEQNFDLTAYIAGRLDRALDQVIQATGQRPAVLGYCMGGNLALALACLRPAKVAALALLATPWDFHATPTGQPSMIQALAGPVGQMLDSLGVMPVDWLQTLFASLNPNLVPRKYAAFGRMARRSAKARDFVALEDWANDGVDLAGPVARECLFGWYGANSPAHGQWRVEGQAVQPAAVTQPTLLVIPQRDRIVPPQSAHALADAIPHARVLTAHGGHVGMLLSPRAKTDLYGPLASWLTRLPTDGRVRPRRHVPKGQLPERGTAS